MKKRIITIGIGEIGCRMAESFSVKADSAGIRYVSVAADCDQTLLGRIRGTIRLSLATDSSVKEIAEKIGVEAVSEWFPCDPKTDDTGYFAGVYVNKGTGRVRANALLAFFRAMNDPETGGVLESAVDSVFENDDEDSVYELYLAASLSGGTGSALFCPMALYVEEYVREKYGKELDSRAFLVAPDVISGACSYEQKISMRASAYAAIRELEAINGVAFSDPGSESISFKLGQKNDLKVGILFDSDDERFHDKKYAPFCAVTVLDRIAGMDSLTGYYNVWSDMMYCSAMDMTAPARAEEKSRALYRGLSVCKFRYSPEFFADYVTAQYCKKRIDAILRPFTAFEKQLSEFGNRSQMERMRQYGRQFPRVFFDLSDGAKVSEKTPFLDLYNCFIWNVFSERTDSDLSDSFDKLTRKLGETLNGFKNGTEKKSKKKIAALSAEIYQKLCEYYADALKCLYGICRDMEEGPETLRNRFRCSIRGIVEDETHPADPAEVFTRLCEIRNCFAVPKEKEEQVSAVFANVFSRDPGKKEQEIPEAFLKMPQAVPSWRSRFGRREKDGFLLLVNGGFRAQDIYLGDAETIRSVLNRIRSDLDDAFLYIIAKKMLPLVDERINAYRRLFFLLPKIGEEMEEAVFNTERICRAGDACCSEIGITEDGLEQAYGDYLMVLSEDESARNRVNAALSDCFAELLDGEDGFSVGSVRRGFMKWKDGLREDYCRSERYLSLSARDIVSAGLESGRKRRPGNDFFALLKNTRTPFTYRFSDDGNETWRPIESNTVYLSEAAADRLCDNATDGWSAERKEKEISDVLGTVCSYASDVSIRNGITDKQIFLVREVRGLFAHTIALFDEFDENGGLFRHYLAALEMIKKYDTEMWNPYVCRSSASAAGIPFIHPAKRRESDLITGKAFLFGMLYRRFSVGRSESREDRSVIYFRNNGEDRPVTERGSEVLAEEPQRIFGWLKGMGDEALHFAETLDGLVRECIRNVVGRMSFDGFEKAAETVLSSEPFSLLTGNAPAYEGGMMPAEEIVPFVSRISEADSPYASAAKGALSAIDEYTDLMCSALGGAENEMVADEIRKTAKRAFFRSTKCRETAADTAEIPE